MIEDEKIIAAKNNYLKTYYNDSNAPLSMHNGWSSEDAQNLAYSAFLQLFDKGGNILDLGCGNGSLLKYIISNISLSLCPYGVDFLVKSIQEARNIILPRFYSNFYVSNVDEYDPIEKRFGYVITSPDYTFESDMKDYVKRCFGWIEPKGKLILYDYKGSNYFQDFIQTWNKLELGTIKIIETNLTIIVSYIKN
ncbi:MAG: hypothetical protein CVU40_17220 [Chloroflexi bacterium HGW-Chloroflexi-2]|nr:MAG: hypothetical protein CVU40_17220 [Chloroflexi bacterium HGW-Chloroflexi-2]